MVKADGSGARGCGYEPRYHILDGCNNIHIQDNNENKGTQLGHTKTYIFTTINTEKSV